MHLLAGLVLLALFSTSDAGPATPATSSDTPPAPLLCLQRHYGVQPVLDMGQWFARLGPGQLLPYDDGRKKTFAQALAEPDLQDMCWRHGQGLRPPLLTDNVGDFARWRHLIDVRAL